mgnify:CR=1 FL=1
MPKALLGKKVGMTQIFAEDGTVIPVTVIEAGPCTVAQLKTTEIDGYNAVQLAFGEIKEHKVNKPLKGHYKKASLAPHRYLREVELEDGEEVKVGDVSKLIFSKRATSWTSQVLPRATAIQVW